MEQWLTTDFNLTVYNLDIGDGYDTSVNTPLNLQVEMFCDVISEIKELNDGFNMIGMSQGGLLARGYVERCNYPRVYNLITLVTPHGGEYDPNSLFNVIDIYSPLIQTTTSFASYWRNPIKYGEYILKCSFLPDINGEKRSGQTLKYQTNMQSLQNFVMVWTENDDVVKPASSGKFNFLDNNLNIVDLVDSKVYQNDVIGLRTLNETGRLYSYTTTCGHTEHRMPSCFPQLQPIFSKFII